MKLIYIEQVYLMYIKISTTQAGGNGRIIGTTLGWLGSSSVAGPWRPRVDRPELIVEGSVYTASVITSPGWMDPSFKLCL